MAIASWRGAIRLLTRNGYDWSPRYPAIVEAINRLKVRSCLINGEAVACDKIGIAVFELLRRKPTGEHVLLYAFDLLELDGQNMRRAVRNAQGDTREPFTRQLPWRAPERASRARRWRYPLPSRLRHGARRHRVQAARLAVS
jgi:ATP dependent DNA ligase domain